MSDEEVKPRRPLPHRMALLILAVLCLFPPYQGPRWGDGLEFAAVSAHLGIAHPPGYPLFTLLGWAAMQMPFSEPYEALLLVCRLSVFGAAAGVYFLIRALLLWTSESDSLARLVAMAGALIFCFSDVSRQAIHIAEIYMLNGALTVGCLYFCLAGALLRRESPRGDEAIAASALLGLAVANHLTAMSLAPLVVYTLYRAFLGGARIPAVFGGALLVGLPAVLYASLMARVPGADGHGIYWNAPTTFGALMDNLRGGEYRQFRFMSIAPGVPFTFEQYYGFLLIRRNMALEATGRFLFGGGAAMLRLGFAMIAVAVGTGVKLAFDRGLRWFVALAAVAMVLQLAFICTYNIPDVEDYFLGIHVLGLPFLIAGTVLGLRALFRKIHWPEAKQSQIIHLMSLVVLVAVYLANYNVARGENGAVFENWSERLLATLPENAVLITAGDGDIYGMWYHQHARGQRQDVMVYGANFMRFPWFRWSISPNDSDRDHVGFKPGPPGTFEEHIHNLSTLVIDPLLDSGRQIFTTIHNPMELQALDRVYTIVPVRYLLTDEEMLALADTHEIHSIFPVLYRIHPRANRPQP